MLLNLLLWTINGLLDLLKEFIYWIKVVIIISRTFGSRYLSYRTVDRMIYMVIFSYVLDVEFNWNFRYFYVKKISWGLVVAQKGNGLWLSVIADFIDFNFELQNSKSRKQSRISCLPAYYIKLQAIPLEADDRTTKNERIIHFSGRSTKNPIIMTDL